MRRPFAVVSDRASPGATGVWSASVVTVMSASTQSPATLNALRDRPDSSSSVGGRRSGGRPYLRRFARSLRNASRGTPMLGVMSVLSTNVPFSTMRVNGAPFVKPRSSSVVAKRTSRDSPGCIAGSSR